MEIKLVNSSAVALIDSSDFPRIKDLRWHLYVSRGKNYVRSYPKRDKEPQKIILLHRLILSAVTGQEIDHIDGDGLNNKRSNLRFCNHSQNMKNKKSHKNSTSKYVGVCYEASRKFGKRWRSEIASNGKRHFLGRYQTEIEAANAHDEAAKKYNGDFARVNHG